MKNFFKLLLLILPSIGFSQTMTTTGNWDDATKWTASNIGDLITENVTLSNSVDPTIRTGFNCHISEFEVRLMDYFGIGIF